jgi:hypothetical protein
MFINVYFVKLLILYCEIALPVFEGLFLQEDDSAIRAVLFSLAEWHTLAKLRLHTTKTLEIFSAATGEVGHQLRKFTKDIAPKYNSLETPKEREKRMRQLTRQAASTGTTVPETTSTRKPKQFHLNRIKFHAMGEYVAEVKEHGTTDSYSTRIVSIFEFNPSLLCTDLTSSSCCRGKRIIVARKGNTSGQTEGILKSRYPLEPLSMRI